MTAIVPNHFTHVEPKHVARDVLSIALVFPMLVAGMVKNIGFDSIGGVDTTLLSAAALGVVLVMAGKQSLDYLPATLPLVIFLLTYIPAIAQVGTTGYAQTKLSKFLFLTLPASLCISLIVSSLRRLNLLFVALGLTGMLACLIALTSGPSETDYGRFAVGDDVLALGYPAATSIVILGAYLRYKTSYRMPALGMMLAIGFVMLASGSRGPLLGSVLALVAGNLYIRRARFTGFLWFGLFVTVFVLAWSRIPEVSRDRLLHSNLEATSVSARLNLLRMSTQAFVENPFLGVGVGRFQETSLASYPYPHNLVAEVAVEAGLLGLLGLSALAAVIIRNIAHSPRSFETVTIFMLVVLYSTKAMVSGDITARDFWLIACLNLVTYKVMRRNESAKRSEVLDS